MSTKRAPPPSIVKSRCPKESMKDLYRKMGYSLCGFTEIFPPEEK